MFCEGGSTILTATTNLSTEFRFVWSDGVHDSILVDDNNPLNIPTDTNGTYTVTVLDNYTGCVNSESFTVTVVPAPEVTITGDLEILAGESTTLTAVSSDSVTYLWSPGGGTTNVLDTGPLFTSTEYTVIVTNAVGCEDTATVTVMFWNL